MIFELVLNFTVKLRYTSRKNTRKLGNSMVYLLRLLADIAIIRKDESTESAFGEEIDQ